MLWKQQNLRKHCDTDCWLYHPALTFITSVKIWGTCIKVLIYAWHLVLPFLVQNLTMQSYNDQTLLMSLTTHCDCIERTEWFSRTLWQLYVYYSLIINTLQCPGKPFCPCYVVCFQVHIWCNYNHYDFNTVSWQTILFLQCNVFSGSHMV